MVTDFEETTENKESIITTRRDLGADETTTVNLLSTEYSSLPFTIGYHTDEAFQTDSARTVTKNQVTVDTDDMTSTIKMSDNTATTVQDSFTSDEHSTSELSIFSRTASTEGAVFETETFASRSSEKLGTSQISDKITGNDFPFSSTATPINMITDETTTLRTITSTEYSSDALSSGTVSTLNPLTDKATTKLQDVSTWKSTEGVFQTEEDFSSQALTINDDSTTDSSTSKPINDLTTLMITTTADDMHPTTRKSFSEEYVTSDMTVSIKTSEPSSTDHSFSDFGTTETDQTVGEYTTTGSSALITSPTFALTMETTIGHTPSESSTTTSITDSPSVPTLTYAETIYTTPITSGAVKSTTFLETRGLLTDGLSSDYTESLETSSGIHVTGNAFTETTYQRVATDESTTYSEGASLEITSISVHTTQTEDAHVSTITTEATEQNPTTHTRTKEPCESCNQETETCVDGRCECRPSTYRTHVNYQCSGTRSFTFTFRIFLIDNDQALYTDDLRDKQSSAFQLLQTDLVKSINSVFEGMTSFLGSEVFSFQSGSIIVTSLVYFEQNSPVTNDSLSNHINNVMESNRFIINNNSSYTLDASSIVVEPTNECFLGIDDCSQFATCSDMNEDGFNCTCIEGYTSTSITPGLLCTIEVTTPTTPTTTEEAKSNQPTIATWILIAVSAAGGAIIIILLVSLFCVIRKTSRRKITHPEDTMVVPKDKKEKLEAYRGYYTSFNESIDESTADSVEDTAL
ncbi:mucin-5AC-like [Lytechinus variegatus]|uniref:mucin-5AC-like n=1 Tax=Lytechinus variegatus TaxID=7654 RepID=UPI001BB147C8|nr:mucin-5AC-like [Lytechinus variegatus]